MDDDGIRQNSKMLQRFKSRLLKLKNERAIYFNIERLFYKKRVFSKQTKTLTCQVNKREIGWLYLMI